MSFWEGSQAQCQQCDGIFGHRDGCKLAPPRPAATASQPSHVLSYHHAKDGLCFARDHDGGVLVVLKDERGRIKDTWALTASGWASIVSHVSAQGESHDTWLAARTFHGGGK